jgi:Cysteine-rich secretory protein family
MRRTTEDRRPLRHRLVAVGVAVVVGLGLAFVAAAPARADSNVDEAQFFADLNAVRARNGVAPLATDGQLINVARGWSAQMACCAGLSHNPNLGSQVSNWKLLGENVGTGGDVASVEAALEASPHHFANMVDPAFSSVGIGVVEAGGAIWVTEDFKQPKTGSLPSTQAPAPAPKPAPRPAPPKPNAPAPSRSSAPSSGSGARNPAVAPTAVAGARTPSPGTTGASAQPAPNPAPPGGSESANSPGRNSVLPAGLAVVSTSPVMDGPKVASLMLFAILAALALLAVRGRLPGVPRLSETPLSLRRR